MAGRKGGCNLTLSLDSTYDFLIIRSGFCYQSQQYVLPNHYSEQSTAKYLILYFGKVTGPQSELTGRTLAIQTMFALLRHAPVL